MTVIPRALTALLCALTLSTSCFGRDRKLVVETENETPTLGAQPASGGHVAIFDLSAGAPEGTETAFLLDRPAAQTFTGLVRSLERALEDGDHAGALVGVDQVGFGWARSAELGRLLTKLRKSGPVVCHAHTLGNATSWAFLRGCDRIWLSSAGEVDTVGLAVELVYFKSALDKLGVTADFLSVGKYKGGVEPFTRDGPSDEARRDLTQTLGSIRKAWLDGAAAARKKPGLRDALERGPWTPKEALARGLVDGIGSMQDALNDVKRRAGAEATRVQFGPGRSAAGSTFAELVRMLAGADVDIGARPHVAVVPALGAITMQADSAFGGGGITAAAMVKTLKRLRKDQSVRAVIVRLDSPGGSPLASDVIWQQIVELDKEKPVVASVGDMAASGGYYIVSAARRIVAESTSIVGSIGVFGGKIVLGPALADLGIHSVTVAASPEPGAESRAAYLSPFEPWDDATRDRVRKQMQSIYDLFVARVAEGRKLPKDKVERLAQGRIYSGVEGHARGLVDELGGLAQAIEAGKKLAGLDPDAPVSVEGISESLLELLLVGEGAESAEVAVALDRLRARQRPFERWLPGPMRPFIASLEPLISGEKVTAALPFAMLLR